jgi:hypothetical protein
MDVPSTLLELITREWNARTIHSTPSLFLKQNLNWAGREQKGNVDDVVLLTAAVAVMLDPLVYKVLASAAAGAATTIIAIGFLLDYQQHLPEQK